MQVLAEQNRAFGYAAAVSLALHALLLLMNPPAMRERPAPAREPPLVARLVEPPPPPPAPAPAPAPAVKEVQLAPKAAPAKRVAKPKPKPAPRATAPIAPPIPAPPPPPAPASEEPLLPEGIEHGAAPALTAEAASPPVAAIAPPAAAPAPDPTAALARFRQQLVELAMRYKRYPPVARDNGWTGDVVVRIEVAASGEVASIRVKTSSGYEVLDEQALEMFRKAAPAVRVPAALRGKDFAVEVRAIYNLQDRPG